MLMVFSDVYDKLYFFSKEGLTKRTSDQFLRFMKEPMKRVQPDCS
jgi:hypothetical protein